MYPLLHLSEIVAEFRGGSSTKCQTLGILSAKCYFFLYHHPPTPTKDLKLTAELSVLENSIRYTTPFEIFLHLVPYDAVSF